MSRPAQTQLIGVGRRPRQAPRTACGSLPSQPILEPEHGLIAIGSGGAFAQSAALALLHNTELAPEVVVKKSLEIAGDICIYTNQNHTIETL